MFAPGVLFDFFCFYCLIENMLYLLKVFFRDLWISLSLIFCGFCQGLSWWWILARGRFGGESFFLHYNIIFGVDLVGEWWRVFFLPLGGLLVIAVNLAMGIFLYNSDKFFSRLLALAAAGIQAAVLTAVYLLVSLNF